MRRCWPHGARYSPQLNGAEWTWSYLRRRHLSDRIDKDYDHLLEAIRQAWTRLDAQRLQSLTHTHWIERAA